MLMLGFALQVVHLPLVTFNNVRDLLLFLSYTANLNAPMRFRVLSCLLEIRLPCYIHGIPPPSRAKTNAHTRTHTHDLCSPPQPNIGVALFTSC